VAVVAAIGWQLLPLAVWQLRVGPQLRDLPDAPRLRVETLEAFEAPPADWSLQQLGDLRIAMPPGFALPEDCAPDAACRISVAGRHLQIFDSSHLEPYRDMINLRAPDERDLSVWRLPTANWNSILALRDRVTTSRSKLDSFRFRNKGSMGVVAQTSRNGVDHWIVAAYALGERSSRGLAFSGFTRADSLVMLGSLDFACP
jgi:hypothetical protein